jgi:hypothetical protein
MDCGRRVIDEHNTFRVRNTTLAYTLSALLRVWFQPQKTKSPQLLKPKKRNPNEPKRRVIKHLYLLITMWDEFVFGPVHTVRL